MDQWTADMCTAINTFLNYSQSTCWRLFLSVVDLGPTDLKEQYSYRLQCTTAWAIYQIAHGFKSQVCTVIARSGVLKTEPMNFLSTGSIFRPLFLVMIGWRLTSHSTHYTGGPARVRPTCIFDGNIWMHSLKHLVIHKNIIINSKANKYQQNYKQTILP